MRLSHPRIEPLESDQWSDEAASVMAPIAEAGPPLNIFKTLAHHPGLMRRWMVFANHVLAKPLHGDRLHDRGILLAPDFVLNSGALIRGTIFHLEGQSSQILWRGTGARVHADGEPEKRD